MARPADLAARIQDDVERALALPDIERQRELREIAEQVFSESYDEQATDDSPFLIEQNVDHFVSQLTAALQNTSGEASPELVSGWMATAGWNAATIAAAPSGHAFIWRTQKDEAVRDIHVPLEGVSQPVGQPFLVGGVPLRYPGEPIGPPEVWINCRCWLDLDTNILAAADKKKRKKYPWEDGYDEEDDDDDEKEMRAAISEEPWSNFSASDYSIEQWRRATLIKMPGGDPESKSTYKLPIRTPSGALSRAGVHAAWAALHGARGGVNAPADQKAKARGSLRSAYRQLGEEVPEALAAAPVPKPANTHDAPGWLTHPKETERLRRYWTKGEGALKIRWGTPGDLTRCEKHLRKYVGPMWAWGTCQNLHHVVFGFFNPESRGHKASAELEIVANAFAAAAELEDTMLPPASLFEDPKLARKEPLTVRAAGDFYEVKGHIASWDECHVGIEGTCVNPPRSHRNYADFNLGEVETDAGFVAVGHLTADTGHAPRELNASDTVRHYEDTGAVVADVRAGEDDYGIWVHGIARPGINDHMLYALRAGTPSGDWRTRGGELELVATLIVNVPGFPIQRPEALAASGRIMSLVAASIVTVDPNAEMVDRLMLALDQREADKDRVARATTLAASMNEERVEKLHRELELELA